MAKRESPAAAVEACADKGARAAIYQCAIGRAGLYHKTFFAHKATPAERRWINDAWHEATKVDMKKRGLGRARRARARRKGRR